MSVVGSNLLAQALCQLANEHLLDQGYSLIHKTLDLAEASFSCSVNYFVIHSSSSYSPTPNPTSDLLHGMLHGKARALSRSPLRSSKNTKKLPFVSILSSFFHAATCSLPTLVAHARSRATSQNLSQFSLYRYKSVQYMESH